MGITNSLKQLITSPQSGEISHTKLWSNIGLFCMTAVFCYLSYEDKLPEWYAYCYATTVAVPQLASKFMSLKFKPQDKL